MASTRKPILITLVAALVIAAAGWFLLISPKKATVADLESQTATEVSGQPALTSQLAMLTADERHAAKYTADLGELKRHMPDDPGQPALFREISTAAAAANVTLSEITPGVPVTPPLVALAPKPAATTDAAATASAAPTPTGATSASGTGAPVASGAPVAAPPVAAGAGLSQLSIALSVSGTYSEIKDFLNRITKFRRSFLVVGVGLTIQPPITKPGAGGAVAAGGPAVPAPPSYSGRLTATVTGEVFSTGTPNVVGTVEPTLAPTPAATPLATVSANPTRRSK